MSPEARIRHDLHMDTALTERPGPGDAERVVDLVRGFHARR
jgi:hypothetical protein